MARELNKKSEENKEIEGVVETEAVDGSIDTESLKENFVQQGKWLRLLWMIGFSFIYAISLWVLWLIVTVQFLFVLFTNSIHLVCKIQLSQMKILPLFHWLPEDYHSICNPVNT